MTKEKLEELREEWRELSGYEQNPSTSFRRLVNQRIDTDFDWFIQKLEEAHEDGYDKAQSDAVRRGIGKLGSRNCPFVDTTVDSSSTNR